MSKPIDQKCVDQVASFVEACAELKNEPFFGKDEKLSVRSSGNRWTFTFGNRFHFRSALISFRRLWMPTEPSNWVEVVEILKNPDLPKGTTLSAEYHEKNIRAVISREAHWLNLKMPSSRIINLWLNTVFAHVSVNELLRATLNNVSLAQLLAALDGRLEIKTLKFGEIKPAEGFHAGWAINRSPINVMDDCVVITDEEGVKVLDVALGKFRQQILKP